MSKKKITVSVISDLTTDQRVIRICTTLVNMGFDVFVIARSIKNSLPLDTYLFRSTRIKCYFKKGVLQYAEFNFKLFCKLIFVSTNYFLANDLDTLIPNYLISTIRNKKLFYDTHEYFTGVPELRTRPVKKKIWKFFEDRIFPKLSTVYTINNSVKEIYQKEYGNKITVLKNLPVTISIEPIQLPENWKNKILLIMQGAGINEGRGGLELLETMKYLSSDYLLLLIGGGNIWDKLCYKRKEWKLESKVEMFTKISPYQLKQITPLAFIGFSLDSFEDLNFLYSLPNKIFDYIHANVPVIATATPEVKKIIERYSCGLCIPNNHPEVIASAIKQMVSNAEEYNKFKQNCDIAAKELCWENEQNKLIEIYQPFL